MIASRRQLKSRPLTETINAAGIIAQCTKGKKLKFSGGLLPPISGGARQPGFQVEKSVIAELFNGDLRGDSIPLPGLTTFYFKHNRIRNEWSRYCRHAVRDSERVFAWSQPIVLFSERETWLQL